MKCYVDYLTTTGFVIEAGAAPHDLLESQPIAAGCARLIVPVAPADTSRCRVVDGSLVELEPE